MSYQEAMEAAGAKVLLFKEFGSYQGDWWAKVEFNGQTGWVSGAYGSCSVCDAFEAEFCYDDYDWEPETNQMVFKDPEGRALRMKEFGASYLHQIMSQEEAEKETKAKAAREYAWDDDREIADFIASSRQA